MSGTGTLGHDTARPPLWRAIGPALITACVVFGPGSLVISSNIGATYGYDLLWMLLLTGLLMGTFLTMSARISVMGGASVFTVLANEAGRPFARLVGVVLCLTCTAFQFSNNLALAAVAGALAPERFQSLTSMLAMISFNVVLIFFLFSAQHIYKTLERVMKVMVGVVLLSFVFNLFMARPPIFQVFRGIIPGIPDTLTFGLPRITDGNIADPLVLIASLFGTTFSVAAAFFQGNFVQEKGWKPEDYDRGMGDSIAGVTALTVVSMLIMITAATVIYGKPADNVATLALTLQPLLGPTAFAVFCIGLIAVAMNPFLINAMIGGTALADGWGLPGRLHDIWPRRLTVLVLLIGMGMACIALYTRIEPVQLMIFGQAMTVIGNPLMAISLLWLANRKKIMGCQRKNRAFSNIFGVVGVIVVVLLSLRMVWFLSLRIGLLLGITGSG